jgi:hypothetical protein
VCLAQSHEVTSKATSAAKNAASNQPSAKEPTKTQPTSSPSDDAVLVGAGDIATCGELAGEEATAELIDKVPGTVFAVGEMEYPDGSDEQFADCYGPTWGRFEERTRGRLRCSVGAGAMEEAGFGATSRDVSPGALS